MDRRLDVRALSNAQYEDVEIILGRGSDATPLPESFSDAGALVKGSAAALWDAQGGKISTGERRDVNLGFEAGDGNVVILRDRGHVSKCWATLVVHGRMLKKGWQILMDEFNQPEIFHANQNVSILISYKNHSLAVAGRSQCISHGESERAQQMFECAYFLDGDFTRIPVGGPQGQQLRGPSCAFCSMEMALQDYLRDLRGQNAICSSLPSRAWTSSATRRQQWMGSSAG